MLVATGILASRLVGLVRQRVTSHYLGLHTDAADAWNAGFKIPNFLQNLFGEGALSASFIPVYASLVAQGKKNEAGHVAAAVGALLALVVSTIVAVGVLGTPFFIEAIAPGFSGPKRELTITTVRILFPGTGLLVLSAWCLGILNSHHRFLVSYSAPVIWSAAMIAALLWYGPASSMPRLVPILAWASVVGSALQFAVQLPFVWRVAPPIRFGAPLFSDAVRTVLHTFVPTFMARGVGQISSYVDNVIGSYLPTGAVTGLGNAQTLYTLPVSLFGMSIVAAELPAMAGVTAGDAATETLRARLDRGLRRIAFLVIPSEVAFLALGDVIAAVLFQTGRFSHDDAIYVWTILAGSAVGLLAQTLGRLYSSTYYALRDAATPFRFAAIRVLLTSVFGYLCALPLPRALGIDPSWGAAGLTASAGVAGWLEMLLLRQGMNRRIGRTGLPTPFVVRMWGASLAGAAAAWAVKLALGPVSPLGAGALILGCYGVVFFAAAWTLGIPEAAATVTQIRRRLIRS
jgi:putative peptidoglycan lipid II flippase